MSCEATPAHASESFEWRIRQHSAEKNSPVNCFSRGSARLAVQRDGATENCFIIIKDNMFIKKKKPQPEPVWRDFREKSYEELEQEVDAAYGEEMRKRNIKIAVIAIILLFVFHDIAGFWLRFGFPRIPKRTEQVIDFVSDPVEAELPEEEETVIKYITLEDKDEVEIRKQASYSISGRVLAKNYLFWGNYLPGGKRIFQSVALFDLGLAWGKMADKKILKNYTFYSAKDTQARSLYPTLKLGVRRPPLPWPYVRTHMVHLNIVPANAKIMSALIYLFKYQPVKLDGYLVDVKDENGRWRCSGMSKYTVNPNARSNASEIMYVTRVQVGKRIYE